MCTRSKSVVHSVGDEEIVRFWKTVYYVDKGDDMTRVHTSTCKHVSYT